MTLLVYIINILKVKRKFCFINQIFFKFQNFFIGIIKFIYFYLFSNFKIQWVNCICSQRNYFKLKFKNKRNGCDGNSVFLRSILFAPNGYMATSCGNPTNKLYFWAPNGSYTGKSIATPQYTYYIGFDSKGRFIQISAKQR